MKKTSTLLIVSACLIFHSSLQGIYAQAPVWNWAADAGGTANAHDKGQSCITDALGNLYVTGYFYSPVITFDSVSLNNTSVNFKADIFLAKYNSAGNLEWVKGAGGTDNDLAISCALDPNGNIIIAGYFSSPVLSVGGFQLTNAGSEDIFVAQFNPAGNVNWAKSFGGGFADIAWSVACDSIGTAFISGYFQSPDILFDNDTLHNTGAFDMFLVKFGISTGSVSWARSATGSDNDIAYSVAADASGNAYLGGYYSSPSLNFGSGSISTHGGYDLFVAKYNGSGTLQWVNDAGGADNDISRSIALDNIGNVYLTGYFGSPSLEFGNITISANATDMFLASFDNSGIDRWAVSAGAAYGEEGTGVCTDFFGNVYVTGTFQSPSIFIGSTNLLNPGNFTEDGFIAAYDNDGINLWAKGVGGSDVDVANAVCADQMSNVFITGYYGSTTIAFDPITLASATGAPYQDMFVARLSTFVGVSEKTNIEDDVYIFPNPAEDKLAFGSRQLAIKKVDIIDVTGRVVLSKEYVNASKQVELTICYLPANIYFTMIYSADEVITLKFVKQ